MYEKWIGSQTDKNTLLRMSLSQDVVKYLFASIEWFSLLNLVGSVLPHHHGDAVVAGFDGW